MEVFIFHIQVRHRRTCREVRFEGAFIAYLDDPAEIRCGLYLGLIGISSWESAIPGFNAGKLAAVDF